MIHRVIGPAKHGASWVRDAALAGVSRLGLEAIDLWGRSRATVRKALRQPRKTLAALNPLRMFRRRSRAAEAAPAVQQTRLLSLVLDFALFGVTAFVVILIHREVYSQMQVRPDYRLRLDEMRMVYRPTPSSPDTVLIGVPVDAELARQAREGDPGLVGGVARRLERNPWVRRVTQVRRVWPDRLEARIEMRRPQALVLRGRRGVCIDADGVRLPDLRGGTILPGGCYEIVGVGGGVPAVGAVWDHPGVRGALDVIRALERYRVNRVLMVTRIDVSNIGGRRDARESEIFCWTAAGVPVAWGRPSTTDAFGENPVLVKMRHLAIALEAFPALRGLERVDLRFDRVVVRPRPEWRVVAAGLQAQ